MEKGVYKFVRHPITRGVRLLSCAMFCWMPTWLMRLLALVKAGAIEGWGDREAGRMGPNFRLCGECSPVRDDPPLLTQG